MAATGEKGVPFTRRDGLRHRLLEYVEIIEREEGISGCPLVKVYNELIKGAGGMPLQEFIILLIVLLTSSLYEG